MSQFRFSQFRFSQGILLASALSLPLQARAVSLSDASSSARLVWAPPLGAPAPVVVQATAETMRPAPLPNPDVEEPGPNQEALAAQSDASLAPGVFNMKSHFAGDGYAPGSNLETDQNHRHTVGGGMNLSVPMP